MVDQIMNFYPFVGLVNVECIIGVIIFDYDLLFYFART